ncbi:MAG: Holliday junction resolvase RuvX [Bifidobacteriaceae bacterium]|jgi:putative Holliday junction resolvase|nr:Holliday junction resolvase RuvX [Bifidobacteriaceae bacterium]
MTLPGPGRRLGVDAGAARVGVALSDPDGLLASPVETIERRDLDDAQVAARIAQLASEAGATGVIVGLPQHLSGAEGAAAGRARELAHAIRDATSLPVRLVDERLSSVQAHAQLHRAGRREKTHRAVVDQVAAVLILQSALDRERATGRPAGQALGDPGSATGGPASAA